MKGSFRVEDIRTPQPGAVVLAGMVLAGSLIPGMESMVEGVTLVIRSLERQDSTTIDKANRGDTINLIPSGIAYDVLLALKDQVIEFTDIRSQPVKEQLALRPQLG